MLLTSLSETNNETLILLAVIIVIILGFIGFGIFETYKLGTNNRRRVEALELSRRIAQVKQEAIKLDVQSLGNKVSDQIEKRFKDIERQQKEDSKEVIRQINEIYQMIIHSQGNMGND